MERIEINEYVRTKEGFIYRIEDGEEFYEDSVDVGIGIIPDVEGKWVDKEHLNYIDKRDIKKHSKNLMDLIENKDILKVKTDREILFLGVDENTLDIKYKEIIEDIKNGDYQLLEILTYEQFEQNSYKVGENDEKV